MPESRPPDLADAWDVIDHLAEENALLLAALDTDSATVIAQLRVQLRAAQSQAVLWQDKANDLVGQVRSLKTQLEARRG